MESVVVAWSGGKDAAYALYDLPASVEIVELFTTINATHDRSTMHGVRRSLHERQADAIDYPLNQVVLPSEPTNEEYRRRMTDVFDRYRERGVDRIVFADINLEDVRSYREELLDEAGTDGYWPLWERDTTELVGEFLDAGFRATLVAVDGDALDASFVGRELDRGLLADLPEGVDPCGENGEFHTFVWDGPLFDAPLPVSVTETVTRTLGETPFHYADLRLRC